MGILSWIVVGAAAGWLASMAMGKNAQMGALANIGVGIAGALIGGFILGLLGIGGITGINVYSILVATLGAIGLLYALDRIKK